MELTTQKEDRFRVTLFKARYKSLRNEGLSNDERFFRAIAETADDKIDLDKYPEIVEEWLDKYTKSSSFTS